MKNLLPKSMAAPIKLRVRRPAAGEQEDAAQEEAPASPVVAEPAPAPQGEQERMQPASELAFAPAAAEAEVAAAGASAPVRGKRKRPVAPVAPKRVTRGKRK